MMQHRIDPATGHPEQGDTVVYTADDGAVFGGVVEESYRDVNGCIAFRIVGHEGTFNHTPEPAWKSRVIMRPDVDWQKVAEDRKRELDVATERLRVIDRRVDRVDLARRLFMTRIEAAYGIDPSIAGGMWAKLTDDYRRQWLAVADEALRLLLVTDL